MTNFRPRRALSTMAVLIAIAVPALTACEDDADPAGARVAPAVPSAAGQLTVSQDKPLP